MRTTSNDAREDPRSDNGFLRLGEPLVFLHAAHGYIIIVAHSGFRLHTP